MGNRYRRIKLLYTLTVESMSYITRSSKLIWRDNSNTTINENIFVVFEFWLKGRKVQNHTISIVAYDKLSCLVKSRIFWIQCIYLLLITCIVRDYMCKQSKRLSFVSCTPPKVYPSAILQHIKYISVAIRYNNTLLVTTHKLVMK